MSSQFRYRVCQARNTCTGRVPLLAEVCPECGSMQPMPRRETGKRQRQLRLPLREAS